MVPPLHQSNLYTKRQLRVWRTQKCNRVLSAINALDATPRQITQFHALHIGTRMEIWETSQLSKTMVPTLHQSNLYTKRQLCVWRTQKCNRLLDAINALGVTPKQITRFHALHVVSRREIWESLKLSKTMVPPLHQSNLSTKRQLWVWRTQKCNCLLGATNALCVTHKLKTHFHALHIGPRAEIWENSNLSKPMVPPLRQSNLYTKRQLRVWRT